MGLIIDNFAGGGGASTGIETALGRPVSIAINHDPEAIASRLDISVRQLKRWVEDKKFPDPVMRDGRIVRWTNEQLVTWIKKVIEGVRTTA